MTENQTSQQQKGIRKTILILLLIIGLILSLFMHKILTPRIMSLDELYVNGVFIHENPRIIKPFELIDHHGKAYTQESLEGKWTWLFFGFTHCPDICPTTMAKLGSMYSQLDEKYQKELQVVMVSVDPARDTQEKLAEYMPHFNEEFLGVTGEFTQILKFSRNVNAVFNKVVQDDDYTVDHSGNIVIISPEGHYFGFIKPPFELSRLKTTFISVKEHY